MLIQSFAVENFRGIKGGIEKNRVNFDGKNAIFLFGQNNVGKSSFLHAYEAFYDDSIKDGDFPFDDGRDITMEISLHVDEATEKAEIDKGTSNKFDNIKENYLDARGILRLNKTWLSTDTKRSVNKTFNVKTSTWDDVSYAGIGWANVFRPLMLRPLFINAMPTEQDVQNIVTEVLKEVATSKLTKENNEKLDAALSTLSVLQDAVYNKTDIDSYKKDVNEKFNSLFGGFEIDIDDGVSRAKFTPDKIGKDFKVSFVDKNNNNNTHEQMGHGAVRMAIFLLMLMRDKLKGTMSTKKSFLVLFEEPELFLHPVLTKKLRSLVYDVSNKDTPFQILCASHSPQMIDISRDHMSLVRMVKATDGCTQLFQVEREDLKNDEQPTDDDIKQKIYEILRFDPFVCEAFYADEVLLVEGDTEVVLARGYQQSIDKLKDVFVVNCHSVVNIPFYQKLFAKFNITYSIICDTDHTSKSTGWNNSDNSPTFTAGVQKTIAELFGEHRTTGLTNKFFVFSDNFEACHKALIGSFKFDDSKKAEGKPFMANQYWQQLQTHASEADYNNVPVIKFFNAILKEPAVPAKD